MTPEQITHPIIEKMDIDAEVARLVDPNTPDEIEIIAPPPAEVIMPEQKFNTATMEMVLRGSINDLTTAYEFIGNALKRDNVVRPSEKDSIAVLTTVSPLIDKALDKLDIFEVDRDGSMNLRSQVRKTVIELVVGAFLLDNQAQINLGKDNPSGQRDTDLSIQLKNQRILDQALIEKLLLVIPYLNKATNPNSKIKITGTGKKESEFYRVVSMLGPDRMSKLAANFRQGATEIFTNGVYSAWVGPENAKTLVNVYHIEFSPAEVVNQVVTEVADLLQKSS